MHRPPGRVLVLLAFGLALWGLALWSGAAAAPAKPAAQPSDEMSMGSPRAKVTVLEYASASCPHCARFNNEVFPAFKRKYIDTGKVRYELREMLTPPADLAAAGFMLARCAGPKRYFAVIDDFFQQQAEIYRTGMAMPVLNAVGAKAGFTPEQVQTCVTDQAALDALNARVARHAGEGVHSTPTFVINGTMLPDPGHEIVLADLDAAIAPLLHPARGR